MFRPARYASTTTTFVLAILLGSLLPSHSSSAAQTHSIHALSGANGEKIALDSLLSERDSHSLEAAQEVLAGTKDAQQQGQGQGIALDAIASVFPSDAPIPSLSKKLQGQGHTSKASQSVSTTANQVFDKKMAKTFALITSTAYCSDVDTIMAWNCSRAQRALPDFKTTDVVFDHAWDLLGFVGYSASLNGVVVTFRGTDSGSWSNWINNLRAWRFNKMYPVPEAPQAMVHAGFYNMWTNSALQANITRAVNKTILEHPGAALYVAGHSMGGAIAQLCVLDLKFKLGIDMAHAFTFGSPRVGNIVYQQLFNQFMNESWRFTHNRDVVPSLPPYAIGYHHVATEIWQVDVIYPSGESSMELIQCDETGEDITCHNSICWLGVCTSIADHLTYLGVPMYKIPEECDMHPPEPPVVSQGTSDLSKLPSKESKETKKESTESKKM